MLPRPEGNRDGGCASDSGAAANCGPSLEETGYKERPLYPLTFSHRERQTEYLRLR
jgi:hypothetical protein